MRLINYILLSHNSEPIMVLYSLFLMLTCSILGAYSNFTGLWRNDFELNDDIKALHGGSNLLYFSFGTSIFNQNVVDEVSSRMKNAMVYCSDVRDLEQVQQEARENPTSSIRVTILHSLEYLVESERRSLDFAFRLTDSSSDTAGNMVVFLYSAEKQRTSTDPFPLSDAQKLEEKLKTANEPSIRSAPIAIARTNGAVDQSLDVLSPRDFWGQDFLEHALQCAGHLALRAYLLQGLRRCHLYSPLLRVMLHRRASAIGVWLNAVKAAGIVGAAVIVLIDALVHVQHALVGRYRGVAAVLSQPINADLRWLANATLDQQTVNAQVHRPLHRRIVERHCRAIVHRDNARA